MEGVIKKIFAVALSFLAMFLLVGCVDMNSSNSSKEGAGNLELNFKQDQDGYIVELTFGEESWKTVDGAIGIRTVRQDKLRPDLEQFYKYSSVMELNEYTLATAIVETFYGSKFKIEDYYKISEDGFSISRNIEVLKQSDSEEGFLVTFPIRSNAKQKVEERKWFAPSAMYGNDGYTFSGTSNKIAFAGEESIAPVDSLAQPFIFNYADGKVFCILDETSGHRETTVQDYDISQTKMIISEAVNLPGIGFRNVSSSGQTNIEMFHSYPAQTDNYGNGKNKATIWRMLPITEGFTRITQFSVKATKEDSFDSAVNAYLKMGFEKYSVVDSRYDAERVRTVLLQAVADSYAVVGGIPQFMTNTDHYLPESGFLFRNVDLAYLLLAEGRRTNNNDYINKAHAVIEDQIKYNRICNLRADAIERYATEGLMNLLYAIEVEKEYGVTHTNWENYLQTNAKARLDFDDPIVFPLMTKMYKYTNDVKYMRKAINIANELAKDHDEFRFKTVLYEQGAFTTRETGCVFLEAYLDLYEITEDKKWLKSARMAADFIISNIQIQTINMEPSGITGLEETGTEQFPNRGYIGNSKIQPYGLSYISSGTNCVDIYAVFNTADFYRLSNYVEDEFYLDMAEYIQYNTANFFNLGDKVGLMDDMLHNAPNGFTNEFFALSVTNEAISNGRGDVHNSNLGWCMYVQLYSYERMQSLTGKYSVQSTEDNTYDLAKFKNVTASSRNNAYEREWNVVDKDKKSYWAPKAEDVEKQLILDLNEVCEIKGISAHIEGCGSKVYVSLDGVEWELVNSVDVGNNTSDKLLNARFLKVVLLGEGKVYNVTANGRPKFYTPELNAKYTGVQSTNLNDRNYDTGVTIDSTSVIVIDLGTVKEIPLVMAAFKNTAISYVIEVSVDGENYSIYSQGENVAKLVYADYGYAKARYIRLKLVSGSALLQEFRVYSI